MPRRSLISSAPSACFPSWAPRITALSRVLPRDRARRRRRPGARAAPALRCHAGRRSRIPSSRAIAGLRDDARAELQRGIALAAGGDVDAAIAAHEAALLRDPALVQAHANLLSLYGRARNWPKAEAHYRAALDAGITNGRRLLRLRGRAVDAGEVAVGEGGLPQAIAINPAHANARNNLGQLLERERDAEGALAQYTQAVDAQPTFRVGRFNLGRMLLVLGRPDQAIAHFAMLQQPVDAETPRYLFALSTAYVRAGKIADGVKVGHDARRLALEVRADRFRRGDRRGARETEMTRRRPCGRRVGRGDLRVRLPRVPAAVEPLFVESAAATGLVFTHVNGATGQYYIAEQMGAGVALFDYDNDGDLDVLLLQGGALDAAAGKGAPGPATACSATISRPVGGDKRTLAVHRRDRAGGCGLAGDIRDGRRGRRLRQRRRSRSVPHLLRSRRVVSQQRQRHVHRRHDRGRRQRPAVEHERGLRRLTTATAIWISSSPTTSTSRSPTTRSAPTRSVRATIAAHDRTAPCRIASTATTATAASRTPPTPRHRHGGRRGPGRGDR